MKKFLSPQQFKLSKADLAPQKEISESPEDKTQSDMGKLQVQMNSVNQPNDWRISLPLQNQPRRVRLQTTERPVHRRLLGESRKNVFVDKQRRGLGKSYITSSHLCHSACIHFVDLIVLTLYACLFLTYAELYSK